ncbi:DUF805 domain-containing protein [Mycobacteroides chelonae]|uniref:DUF805 domain-containing protein n=1 Tax=Mycobacteroides chelonae TaxID=1774 RepID=UPI000A553342|nr:DUF805 domain-containing protein [Mycobacteroides chelonae]
MTHAEPSPPKTNCQEVSKPLGATDPRDLTLPLYGATFGQAITRFFRSYARFSGRASRSEYWWVMLAQTAAAGLLVCGVALGTESSLERLGVTVLIGFMLVWGIPAWALTVRRLHDADFSGWMAAPSGLALHRILDADYLRLPTFKAAWRMFRPPLTTASATTMAAALAACQASRVRCLEVSAGVLSEPRICLWRDGRRSEPRSW